MTHSVLAPGNPFASFLDPESVLAACAASPLLRALTSTVHRPLEKPILGKASDVAAFDAAIDRGSASVASRPVPRRRKLTVEAEAPASAKPPALPTIPPGYSDILLPSFDWATGLHSSSAPERR